MGRTTPEEKVKQRVREVLRQRNVFYFCPIGGTFGRSGIPDFVCCVRGRFVGVECKAGSNTPTEAQKMEMRNIGAAGGETLVVNEHNLDELCALLDRLGAPA